MMLFMYPHPCSHKYCALNYPERTKCMLGGHLLVHIEVPDA